LTARIKNILFCLALCLSGYGQVNVDSVKKVISTAVTDTTRIEAYNYLGMVYAQKDLELSRKYVDSALMEIERGQKHPTASPVFYEQRRAMSYNILSHICFQQGNYNQSIQYCLDNVKLFEKYKDTRNIASLYGTIGMILKSIGNTKDALSYIRKNVSMDEQAYFSDKKDKQAKVDLIASYINLAATFLEAGANDSCIHYSRKTMPLLDTTVMSEDLGIVYTNIGAAYGEMKDYSRAIEYTEKGLKNYLAAELPENISMAYSNLSELNLYLKNYTKALYYADLSEEINKKNSFSDNLLQVYDIKAGIYSALKDAPKEIFYLKKYASLKDSLQKVNHTIQIEELKTQYETEKKEIEIIRLNKDGPYRLLY
jgi:tetratricopeptide (TPR) repeat protein